MTDTPPPDESRENLAIALTILGILGLVVRGLVRLFGLELQFDEDARAILDQLLVASGWALIFLMPAICGTAIYLNKKAQVPRLTRTNMIVLVIFLVTLLARTLVFKNYF
jgi:hypothetical protein